jgi:D-serine deaminase-like pyridoxal phosphate-dependent protein
VRLAIAVDSVEGHRAAGGRGARRRRAIDVFVEVDVGHGRCGAPATAAGSLAHRVVAHAPPEGGLRFAGLQAYHGAAQHLRAPASAEAARAMRRRWRARPGPASPPPASPAR